MFVDPCIIVQFIKENPTRCSNVSKFYYSLLIWGSTCFRGNTAHHQEPKTVLEASGFSCVEVCWTLSGTYCAWQRPPTTRPTTFHAWKTRGCQCSFRLLMMGGVTRNMLRLILIGNNKILIHCFILLDFPLWTVIFILGAYNLEKIYSRHDCVYIYIHTHTHTHTHILLM